MSDAGHKATDKILADMEKKMQREYTIAARDVKQKTDDYLAAFKIKDAEWKRRLADGECTKTEYKNWRTGQMMTGKRYQQLQNELAENMVHCNQIAHATAYGYQPEVYALNYNFATYDIEHGGKLDTHFTLYDKQTVERLMRDDPDMLPPPGAKVKREIALNKDLAWNKQQVQSVMFQGIVQGESIDGIAKRLSETVATRNYAAAVRYARTMTTNTQNAGRYEGYRRADKLGVDLTIEWSATLDNRTRHEHRQLSGQRRNIDEPFEVDCNGTMVEILYPAQLSGETSDIPQEMIWNCRCTLLAWVKGFEGDTVTSSPKMGEKSFEEWQDELMTLDYAERQQARLEAKIAKLPGINDELSGIWKGKTVKYADYDAVKGSIQAKKDYYNQQIKELDGAQPYTKYMKDKLAAVEKYEQNGAQYSQVLKDYERAKANVERLTPAPEAPKIISTWGAEAYTQERRDKAIWMKSSKDADDYFRPVSSAVWRNASHAEKDGIFEYTKSYSKYNEPLRGYEYGTNRFLGVGNTDLNAGYQNNGTRLNAMTDIISKSTYKDDVWLQRGVDFNGMDKFFQCDMDLLRYGTEEELNAALLGKHVTEYGNMSCGSCKNTGFNGAIMLNVYCPSGTKMMYVEPFSWYGYNDSGVMNRASGINWDGITGQTEYGSELETILRNTTGFNVAKITRETPRSTVYVDLWVTDQNEPQRWIP